MQVYRGVMTNHYEIMGNNLLGAYKPDVWMTLETFSKDTQASVSAQDKVRGLFLKFVQRLTNRTNQHIRWCVWIDRQPSSGKLHIHATLTFEKFVIPEKEIGGLWLGMVSKKNVSLDEIIGNFTSSNCNGDKLWKSMFASRITTDRRNIKTGMTYGFKKHEVFQSGSTCPRKGSCKHRTCWLHTDEDWNKVLVRR